MVTLTPQLTLLDYSDALAGSFRDINAEWIEAMFVMEPHDEHVLNHPRSAIIDRGGDILFVEAETLGIVGTGALMPNSGGSLELTKMGVRETARGLKAGEFLLSALIARAQTMAPRELYLLTSSKCEAAVHLYEKAGFVHCADIMTRFGTTYARCNVAMRYPLDER